MWIKENLMWITVEYRKKALILRNINCVNMNTSSGSMILFWSINILGNRGALRISCYTDMQFKNQSSRHLWLQHPHNPVKTS